MMALLASGPASAQESERYVMRRVTVAATGAAASSTTYDMRVTLGQAGPVGAVSRCGDGYQQTAGFWSLLGDQPVPNLLFVARDGGNQGGLVLTWSGSASQYDLFRSADPTAVLEPGSYVRTVRACSSIDLPPASPRLFYQVVPSGP